MSDLINEYISLAIEHGETTLTGDFKRGNKIHAKMMKIVDNIKDGKPDIKEQFYTLMHHDSDSVKVWTAVTLLKTFEDEALTVLKSIEKKDKDIFALNAKMSIDSWTKGMLTNS
ncbi:DUF2019 domain-containing protein [Alistipes sp. ZOR0009]|uniref:DUF2019 domain-containing protein n=1 Tax=Alistipes sp. ZOR0009 TaxID=1339253 RepID=UPI00064839A0|nr:DUF2019 domain-containing protein [Alistipes sp. ZOR0009]